VGALLVSTVLAALILYRPTSALTGGGSSARYRSPRIAALVAALWGCNLLVLSGGTAITLIGALLAVLAVAALIAFGVALGSTPVGLSVARSNNRRSRPVLHGLTPGSASAALRLAVRMSTASGRRE
jgi:hypothetical protein